VTSIMVTLLGDVRTFMMICYRILLRLRNIWDRICRGNQNTHWWSVTSFWNFAVHEIMWKNAVDPDRSQINVIWHMCFACWITEAMDTHSEYVVLIAFLQQQWLCECTLLLLYTEIACNI